MINQFLCDLFVMLDEKYGCVVYDVGANFLEITIDKNESTKGLGEIMEALNKEIMYPLQGFNSNPSSYIFTYILREE